MKRSLRQHLASFWPAYLALARSLAATGTVFVWARRVILQEQQQRFDQAVSKFRHTVDLYFSAYFNILNALTGFYTSDPLPNAAQFRTFLEAQGLRTSHLGLFDMGYVAWVRPGDRSGILEQARQQGFREDGLPRFREDAEPEFLLLHWDDFKPDRQPHLAMHLFREPDRLATMNRAVASGNVACSGKLDLYLGNGQVASNGFVLYAPVYRSTPTPPSEADRQEQLKGLTFLSFFVAECWDTIYRMAAEPAIDLEIYDGVHRTRSALWYDSDGIHRGAAEATRAVRPAYEWFQAVGGMGREWTFYCASTPAFESASSLRLPWLLLLAGSAVSVTLFLLSFTQVQARLRAEGLARQLQETNEHMVAGREQLLQERLRSSRLESVGLLAGGIAHDFNNILTAILGNISLASLDAAEQGNQRAALREAELACHRARDLTQQLLTFAKGGAPIRTTAQLDRVILESARFATHGSAARCECLLPDHLWPVEADTGQIGQVIQNIVLNAAQAMPEGGVITLQAQNLELEAGNPFDLRPGRYLCITVQDHGTGIRPEHLDRIFDPYFSTKQRGSGLGLATSYSIVRRHEGTIHVQSTLGQGSRFSIYLPASDRPAPPPPSPAAPPLPAGRGWILAMDDEPAVLDLLKRMLEKLGYEVIAATDGAEAIRLFEEARAQGRSIEVAILDLTVPGGLGGEPTLKQLRALQPGLKAIVSSGYSSAPVMANHGEFGFQAVVPKPYGIESLAAALASLSRVQAAGKETMAPQVSSNPGA